MRGPLAIVAAAAALCAGCLSSSLPETKKWSVVPRDDLPPGTAPLEGGATAFGATRLGGVSVDAPCDRAPFVVHLADGSIDFDHYNVFASAPAALLRAPVKARLEADGRFGRVVSQSSVASSDAQVEVTVKDLSLDCRAAGRRRACAAVSVDVVKTGLGPRKVALSGSGSGAADAAGGNYSEAFSSAFDAALAEALRSLK